MTKSLNIAIIGCGYIGLEVASLWGKKGDHVTATTRSPERLSELSKHAQKSIILKGNDEDEFVPLISQNETILVTTAADSPEHYESAYLETAQIFRKLALEMDLPRDLIYTSSSSVYGDHHGLFVDEESDLLGKGELARILIETEKVYLSLEELGWNVCIFRLSEIYGPGREVSQKVRACKDRPMPGTGEQYTNMIHKADCAGAINYALKHHLTGIYNLADDDHIKRKDLYHQVSQKYHLPEVQWDPTLTSLHGGNKRVSNHKIKKAGYRFIHPHLFLED